jgi:outer membrane protein TolC
MVPRLGLYSLPIAVLLVALIAYAPNAHSQQTKPRLIGTLGPPIALDGPPPAPPSQPKSPLPSLVTPDAADKPLPINLATALQLAHVRPIDIQIAVQQIQAADAQFDRARWLWLPTLYLGGDYFRHDGQLQDVVGNVFGTSKSGAMVGAGPSAVFSICDALLAPLIARQELQARQAGLQVAQNDTVLAVAEAYFRVQQARGDLAGAVDTVRRAEELVRRTGKLAPGLIPPAVASQAEAELARRRQTYETAREHWRSASADLARLLRLEPTALLEPIESPHLKITLIGTQTPVDDLVPIALLNRPELAAQKALVQATLERLRQEKLRPLIPSVLLRGFSTPVTGTLGVGYFGGGINSHMGNFSARSDLDFQILWELPNLGVGTATRIRERRAENEIAVLRLFQVQDRIAAEVVQAYAQAQAADERLKRAETGLRFAADSYEKHVAVLAETRSVGGVDLLIVRPQEVLSTLQSLAQAYTDYYTAAADRTIAQFRLYRALGHPAQALCREDVISKGVP